MPVCLYTGKVRMNVNLVENYYLGMTIVVVMSYLLGSLPTAYLVAKAHRINIFDVGSGNMGFG